MANFLSGFLGLGTGGPGSFTELAGTGYARQAVTFGPLVGAISPMLSGVTFAAGGAWPTATQYGLYDAAGNQLLSWSKRTPLALASGATHTLDALTIRIPDIALAAQAAALIFPPSTVIGIEGRGGLALTTGVAVQIANGQIGIF